jgi:hypothetical protein
MPSNADGSITLSMRLSSDFAILTFVILRRTLSLPH